ncbi:hypothetical protein HNQ94_000444 [Salirhabdus euzebyi]|uniref:Phosphoesterase n=1 Tax=Salirhabdus euzebyi TaxID=394506 RepID=A0A841Q1F4_9BACI|nr:metallophosphoesterase [Salirhabdus euzebyi]MBB6452023.1 hypothetical protein [Salirhabdus euzebyi]
MPTVIIVSDSHGLEQELLQIKNRHKNEADVFIHCGDSELDFHSAEMEGFKKVRGNCDFDRTYPEEIDFQVDGLSFYVTHGHLFNVKSTLMPLSYRSEETGAQIACFGHSHMSGAEKVGGKLFINPGSIRSPRGGAGGTAPTYVKLSWHSIEALKIEFLDVKDATVLKDVTENLA